MLPSRGFMRVAGVLPSAELRLTVHAYETKAGDAWLRRAAMDASAAEATAAMGERDLSIGGNDEWIHAQLGAARKFMSGHNRLPQNLYEFTRSASPRATMRRADGLPQPAWR